MIGRVLDELFGVPVLTTPRAKQRLGVTYRSAQLNVEKLIRASIVQEVTQQRPNRVLVAHDSFGAMALANPDSL